MLHQACSVQSCNLLQMKLGWDGCKNTMHHNANAQNTNKRPSAETRLHLLDFTCLHAHTKAQTCARAQHAKAGDAQPCSVLLQHNFSDVTGN